LEKVREITDNINHRNHRRERITRNPVLYAIHERRYNFRERNWNRIKNLETSRKINFGHINNLETSRNSNLRYINNLETSRNGNLRKINIEEINRDFRSTYADCKQ